MKVKKEKFSQSRPRSSPKPLLHPSRAGEPAEGSCGSGKLGRRGGGGGTSGRTEEGCGSRRSSERLYSVSAGAKLEKTCPCSSTAMSGASGASEGEMVAQPRSSASSSNAAASSAPVRSSASHARSSRCTPVMCLMRASLV